jgi:4-hydroxy-tetrahydrodipicolinate synthase
VQSVPRIIAVKVEDPPTPQRVAQIVATFGDGVAIIGGLGGVYLLDELRCGSSGTMTGFAYPEVLVAVVRAWQSGDHAQAAALYYWYLPLLVAEGQPKLGLVIRKELLRRRGLIAHAAVREPGPIAEARTLEALSQTLADVDIDAAIERGDLRGCVSR